MIAKTIFLTTLWKRPGGIEPRYFFSAALNQIPHETHDPIDNILISSDHNCDNLELPWATNIQILNYEGFYSQCN